MEAYTMIAFDRDDIQKRLPYALIGETASRAIWDTGKRKKLFAETFDGSERDTAYEIIKQSKKWLLKTGVPDTVRMRASTFALWNKLADFCASIW